jgi:hypothetical protein
MSFNPLFKAILLLINLKAHFMHYIPELNLKHKESAMFLTFTY